MLDISFPEVLNHTVQNTQLISIEHISLGTARSDLGNLVCTNNRWTEIQSLYIKIVREKSESAYLSVVLILPRWQASVVDSAVDSFIVSMCLVLFQFGI